MDFAVLIHSTTCWINVWWNMSCCAFFYTQQRRKCIREPPGRAFATLRSTCGEILGLCACCGWVGRVLWWMSKSWMKAKSSHVHLTSGPLRKASRPIPFVPKRIKAMSSPWWSLDSISPPLPMTNSRFQCMKLSYFMAERQIETWWIFNMFSDRPRTKYEGFSENSFPRRKTKSHKDLIINRHFVPVWMFQS